MGFYFNAAKSNFGSDDLFDMHMTPYSNVVDAAGHPHSCIPSLPLSLLSFCSPIHTLQLSVELQGLIRNNPLFSHSLSLLFSGSCFSGGSFIRHGTNFRYIGPSCLCYCGWKAVFVFLHALHPNGQPTRTFSLFLIPQLDTRDEGVLLERGYERQPREKRWRE